MAHINRRFIDKHWMTFIVRGIIAVVSGCLIMFVGALGIENIIAMISVLLLLMGIIDAVGALYSSTKKHGWINSIIDALVDVVAAVALLFFAKDNVVNSLVILSLYTVVSGIIDIFHGFLSTVDPTDRFIRILVGACGCVIGFVMLNAGNLEIITFIRFFGAYMLIVGVTSLIYGVHNRAQLKEDLTARKEARKKTAKTSKKSSTKKRK